MPANRWTTEGSPEATDWAGIDFGIARPIDTVKLYILDDGQTITAPAKFTLEYWDGKSWSEVPGQKRTLETPAGHVPNVITFPMLNTEKLRAVFTHSAGGRSGLSEFEAWGQGELPVKPAPPPAGNLALNETGQGFPKASASFTSPFDFAKEINDGKIMYSPNPRNRWTAYQSKNKTDWVEIDFGQEKTAGRATLHLFDDHGGVQAPASYTLEYWDGTSFKECQNQSKTPKKPAGGRPNEVTFTPVKTQKLRAVFTHKGESRSGLTELEIWAE